MRQGDYSAPTDAFVRSIDVHELLPQQEPLVMIGSLEHYDVARTVTSLQIQEGNLFVEDGKFTAAGMIENMAQTCAARIGYINKYIIGKGVQGGYIAAIRNMEIHACPLVGERITTEINVVEEVFGMTLITARITRREELMASAEMKIVVKDDKGSVD